MISSLLGFAVGLTLGLTGAGGGILAVPALVLGAGLSMTAAAPVALIAVGLAAFTGALDGFRRRLVRYKAAFLMSIVGGGVSPLGVWLAQHLSEFWLKIIFSAIMCLVAARMYQQTRPTSANNDLNLKKTCIISNTTGRFIWNLRSLLTISTVGAVSGLFTGLLGVGGGFIIVPALKRFTNLSMHSIVATSLLVIALISAITVLNTLLINTNLHPATWPFVALVVAGMVAGRVIAPKIPAKIIQIGFAVLCILSALIVLLNAFFLS